MIIVKLLGGLGNQLFQYAAGRYLSIKLKQDLIFDLEEIKDRSPKTEFTFRDYELDIFQIPATIAKNNELKKFYFKPKGLIQRYLGKFYREVYNIQTIHETNFNDLIKVDNPYKSYYISGYWQNPVYASSIENNLRNDLIFKLECKPDFNALLNEIQQPGSVSIHIRRGDYVRFKSLENYYAQVNMNYYRNAVTYIAKQIVNPRFYIFSDEPAWVQDHFNIDFQFKIMPMHSAAEDLKLMSKCNHNIITNSTSSWWGAWLNSHPNKLVIAPQKWFNETDNNIAIPNWVKIPN